MSDTQGVQQMVTKEGVRETLARLLELMGIQATVEASESPEQIDLEVAGEEAGLVIGKHGATLDALQYLLNKMNEGDEEDEGWRRIVIDAEGYRARREATLIELATRLGERARDTGRPVTMDPMTPHDRRIVHMALANVPGVTTRSEGEGAFRRVRIFPQRAPGKPASGEP